MLIEPLQIDPIGNLHLVSNEQLANPIFTSNPSRQGQKAIPAMGFGPHGSHINGRDNMLDTYLITMNLKELIKPHLEETVTRSWYGNGTITDRRFKEPSRPIIERKICGWFKKKGWKNKQKSLTCGDGRGNCVVRYRYVSRKDHVKFNWELTTYSIKVELQSKTEHGGWSTVWAGYDPDLNELLEKADGIKPVRPISKKALPDPIPFIEDKNVFTTHTGASLNVSVMSAQCLGVYGLSEDGSLDEKELYKPGEDAWLFIRCGNGCGNVHYIITNGDSIYNIKNSGKKKRITSCTSPGIAKPNHLDKMVIDAAIQVFWDQEEEKSQD